MEKYILQKRRSKINKEISKLTKTEQKYKNEPLRYDDEIKYLHYLRTEGGVYPPVQTAAQSITPRDPTCFGACRLLVTSST